MVLKMNALSETKMTEGSTQRPDTIRVIATYEEELVARRAILFITIQGSSLVTGSMAFKKAKEVNLLVTNLKACGLEETDIQLESVRLDTSSGMFGKSSSAMYYLRIRCNDLERLTDILDVLSGQANNRLTRVQWLYPQENADRDRWMMHCLLRANEKAKMIAEGMGVRLLGIHTLEEMNPRDFHRIPELSQSVLSYGMNADVTEERHADRGLEIKISNTKDIVIGIAVEYRVSGYGAKQEEESQ